MPRFEFERKDDFGDLVNYSIDAPTLEKAREKIRELRLGPEAAFVPNPSMEFDTHLLTRQQVLDRDCLGK
jgi:hypothetical protein